MRRGLWREIEPRNYAYSITPAALVQAFLIAYVRRLPGLRAVTERCAHLLGTNNFSSLTHAVRRRSTLAFVRRMVDAMTPAHRPDEQALVAIDSMAVTLPRTQRHRCKKYNRKTVGGGVLWTYMIDAARGMCPVQVLRTVEGAWHDSRLIREATLIARGPVYLMDRGFYALDLIEGWLSQGVRFIVRAKTGHLKGELVRPLRAPRRIGNVRIELDGCVRLGGPQAKTRPVVRLVLAVLPSGERLALASDRFDWSTEQILAAYKKRHHIERFHRFLKDAVGLAHLYSFDQGGITFLLMVALLLAMLLFATERNPDRETIHVLQWMLRRLRRTLGLSTPWKRNTFTPRRAKNTRNKIRVNH